jgi:glycerol-3-phosphate dehydrogenase
MTPKAAAVDRPSDDLGPRTREVSLERFSTERFDVCVVGGGIAGAGAALDAATRGFSVALIDARDFASGTSGRSSELIHGGLRYLASGDVRLCRESVRERDLLRRLAPHLVRPLLFLLPVPPGRSRFGVRMGLVAYDALGGSARPGRHSPISRPRLGRLAPSLRWERVRGAWGYWDAHTSDARLVLEVVRAAHRLGVAVAPYVKATGFEPSVRRDSSALSMVDTLSGMTGEIRARCVVNATGVWGNGSTTFAGRGLPRLRPSKGVHLMLPRSMLPLGAACVFPGPDARPLFAVPYGETVMIGTTDTDYVGPLDRVSIDRSDLAYLFTALEASFHASPEPGEIVSGWAGLRPLLEGHAEGPSDLSRHHHVSVSHDGVVTLTGGKLTTYRRGAEHAIDAVTALLGEKRASRTARVPLGCTIPPQKQAHHLLGLAQRLGMERRTLLGLISRHGDRTRRVLELIERDPSLAEPLGEPPDPLLADGIWAARNESVYRLTDLLDRRMRLTSRSRDGGLGGTLVVRVAAELGWDAGRLSTEIADVERSVAQERGPLTPPTFRSLGSSSGSDTRAN